MSNEVSDFIDTDFQSTRKAAYTTPLPSVEPAAPIGNRPPTREEIESMVSQKQQKLAELKRAQEELERERAALEELRRRQAEFHNGREEMLQSLTRGVGLLEEAELAARREADQMARSLADFREAITKVQAINETSWSQENLTVELTKALTVIENARMEWNSARLKFPVLNGVVEEKKGKESAAQTLATMDLWSLCKVGLALTWPLVVLGSAIFAALLIRR